MSKEKQKPETKSISLGDKLSTFLQAEPVLAARLLEALECQRFFITVTFLKKYKPDDKNDLHHFFVFKGIEHNDCLKSLRHINNDFIAKHVPLARLADGDGWH